MHNGRQNGKYVPGMFSSLNLLEQADAAPSTQPYPKGSSPGFASVNKKKQFNLDVSVGGGGEDRPRPLAVQRSASPRSLSPPRANHALSARALQAPGYTHASTHNRQFAEVAYPGPSPQAQNHAYRQTHDHRNDHRNVVNSPGAARYGPSREPQAYAVDTDSAPRSNTMTRGQHSPRSPGSPRSVSEYPRSIVRATHTVEYSGEQLQTTYMLGAGIEFFCCPFLPGLGILSTGLIAHSNGSTDNRFIFWGASLMLAWVVSLVLSLWLVGYLLMPFVWIGSFAAFVTLVLYAQSPPDLNRHGPSYTEKELHHVHGATTRQLHKQQSFMPALPNDFGNPMIEGHPISHQPIGSPVRMQPNAQATMPPGSQFTIFNMSQQSGLSPRGLSPRELSPVQRQPSRYMGRRPEGLGHAAPYSQSSAHFTPPQPVRGYVLPPTGEESYNMSHY